MRILSPPRPEVMAGPIFHTGISISRERSRSPGHPISYTSRSYVSNDLSSTFAKLSGGGVRLFRLPISDDGMGRRGFARLAASAASTAGAACRRDAARSAERERSVGAIGRAVVAVTRGSTMRTII